MKRSKHFFLILILAVIAVSFYLQFFSEENIGKTDRTLDESAANLPENESTNEDESVKPAMVKEKLENMEEEDRYRLNVLMDREDFLVNQIKNINEEAFIHIRETVGGGGKISIKLNEIFMDEDGSYIAEITVTSYEQKDLVLLYRNYFQLQYLNEKLMIPDGVSPANAISAGVLIDYDEVVFAKYNMDGTFYATDEFDDQQCLLRNGENNFKVKFYMYDSCSEIEGYSWKLTNLTIPVVTQYMEQWSNRSYIINF